MNKITQLRILIAGFVCLASAFVISSCGEDDPASPLPSFEYEANGRVVTFTNTSTNAKTYTWNFGDGQTSTEENPTHTYEVYGDYDVTLSASGDGGNAVSLPDRITLSKTSEVQINGTFTDWANIPDAATAPSDSSTLTKLKVDYDNLKIYLYVEGTSDMKGYFDIYIDADNDSTTGTPSAFDYIYHNMGADYLLDGYIGTTKDADLFKDNPAVDGWCWYTDCSPGVAPVPIVPVGSGFVSASDLVDIGGGKKAIEFTMLRASIPNLETVFNIGVTDVDAGGSWGTIGSVPLSGTENSVMFKVDMTK